MASSGIHRKSELDTAPVLISIVYKYIGPHVSQQVIGNIVSCPTESIPIGNGSAPDKDIINLFKIRHLFGLSDPQVICLFLTEIGA